MKQKIKINNLVVSSFVTSIPADAVIGGANVSLNQCSKLTCGIVSCTYTIGITCPSFGIVCTDH